MIDYHEVFHKKNGYKKAVVEEIPMVIFNSEEERWAYLMASEHFGYYRWQDRAFKYAEGTLVWGEDNGRKKASKDWFCAGFRGAYDYLFGKGDDERYGCCVYVDNEIVCGFYDFEFLNELNPGKCMEDMIDIWFDHHGRVWEKYFPGLKTPELDDFLFLSASDERKASYHIYGPIDYAWKDIYHLKRFVMDIADSINSSVESGEIKHEDVLINTLNEMHSEGFIDIGVYNHKGSLRIFGCTKYGESRPLVVSSKHPLPKSIKDIEDEKERNFQIFILSTIMAVHPDRKLLSHPNETAVEDVKPNSYFKRLEQESKLIPYTTLIFKNSAAADQETATHFEVGHKLSFRDVDSDVIYELIENTDDYLFATHEIMTPITKLIMSIDADSDEIIQYYIPKLQEILYKTLERYPGNVILYRHIQKPAILQWPDLSIDLSSGSLLVQDIKNKLDSLEPSKIIDLYPDRSVILLHCGYPSLLSNERVHFIGEYTNSGTPTAPTNPLTLMKHLTVRIPHPIPSKTIRFPL